MMTHLIIRDLLDSKDLDQNGLGEIKGGNSPWSNPLPLFADGASAYSYAYTGVMGSTGLLGSYTNAYAYRDPQNFLAVTSISVTSATATYFAVIGAISNGSSTPSIFVQSWSFT